MNPHRSYLKLILLLHLYGLEYGHSVRETKEQVQGLINRVKRIEDLSGNYAGSTEPRK